MTRRRFARPCSFSNRKTARRYGFQGLLDLRSLSHRFHGLAAEDYGLAVHQVALTSLRNIIGQHLLDEVLKDRNTINQALRDIVDGSTEAWGVRIEMVEMKDVEIPEAMQRAMAREAEAVREKRARLIKAEAEQEAAAKLSDGARQISENPIALELRRMQMIAEVGAEQNTTTIVLMPSDFVNMAGEFAAMLHRKAKDN